MWTYPTNPAFPAHYLEIPTDPVENLKWRRKTNSKAIESSTFRRGVMRKCWEDPIYFINGFCVTQKPKPMPKNLLFILYPRQCIWAWMMATHFGRSSLVADKSREMGISWMAVYEGVRWFIFVPGFKMLMCSWKERYVWNPGDMDALFTKFQFAIAHLPPWMRPKSKARKTTTQLKIINPGNQAIVTGEATVENAGRAGRQTVLLLDEAAHMRHLTDILASTIDTCDCRILQSTPTHSQHEFARQREKHREMGRYFAFWWPDHPIKAQGLAVKEAAGEEATAGRATGSGNGPVVRSLKPVATLDDLRPESGFWSDDFENLRGKLTSPWFERRCLEAVNAGDIARNVEIDDVGTGHRFFDEELLQDVIERYCQPPFYEGELVDGVFVEAASLGALKLWFHPSDGKVRSEHRFVCGCDIASGSADEHGRGVSNSCAVVYSGATGEVVAEYTVHGVPPDDFAVAVHKILKWFSASEPAFLIWEDNGPGVFFSKVIREDLGWSSFYYRQQEKKSGKPQTQEPGWWSTKQTKYAAFLEFLQALKEGHVIERNLQAVKEMRQYQCGIASVYHVSAEVEEDPTAAKEAHGDRVVARVMAWRGLKEIGYKGTSGGLPDEPVRRYHQAPVGSPAWCRDHDMVSAGSKDLSSY